MSDQPTDGATKLSLNIPRNSNPAEMASMVPPGMGELNYIQMLLAGLIDQSLYTTSSPTFLALTLSGLTASTLVGTTAAKQLQSVNPGTSLSLSGTSLNTIQGIRTVDSPAFAGATIGTGSGILKSLSGVVGQATIGTSLSYSAPTLDAIQDIRTSASPAFAGLTLTNANFPVISVIRTSTETTALRAAFMIEHRTTGNMADGFGSGFLLSIRDSAAVSNYIAGFYGVRAGADNTGDLWLYTALAGVAVYPLIAKSTGLVNITTNIGLGIADTNASHYLRLVCGSNLTADRNLTFTTGDAARTLTIPIPASDIVNTPAGGIVADDVQEAINELDTEKAARSIWNSQSVVVGQGVVGVPVTVAVAEERIIGRITGGDVTALTAAQVVTMLGASGKLKQVVYSTSGVVATGTTVIPYDDTIPQNTEGDEYFTRAVTPNSATNYLLFLIPMNLANSVGGFLSVALFQDSTANALAWTGMAVINTGYSEDTVLIHIMAAGTTSATTFKVRAGSHVAGTTTVNGDGGNRKGGGVLLSGIIIMEVEP